jgi:hypothetical protein
MAERRRLREKTGQDAAYALGMGGSSCCFDRARSRPAKFIKGTKKAAYYSKTRCSPQSLARRLASPFFLPAASSYHEVLAVAQHAKANAARAEAEAFLPWCGLVLCIAAFSPFSNFPPSSFCLSSTFGRSGGGGGTRRDRTPPTRSTKTEAAAASTAPAAARPRSSKARRRQPTAHRFCALRRAWRGASRRSSSCRPLRRTMSPHGCTAGQGRRRLR